MEFLIELWIEVVIGSSVDVAQDKELLKGFRIGLLSFISILYLIFSIFLIVALFKTTSIVLQVLYFGIVLFFAYTFIIFWKKLYAENE